MRYFTAFLLDLKIAGRWTKSNLTSVVLIVESFSIGQYHLKSSWVHLMTENCKLFSLACLF